MLGLTGILNYYFFNGSIDMRKGVYGLSDVVRHEMKQEDAWLHWVFFSAVLP